MGNLQSVFYHVSLIWYICQLISHIASLPQMKNVRHFWGGLFIWSRKKMVILWYWFVVDIIIEIIAIRYLLELAAWNKNHMSPQWTHFHDSRPTSLCSYSLIVHAWWRNSQYQFYSFFFGPHQDFYLQSTAFWEGTLTITLMMWLLYWYMYALPTILIWLSYIATRFL